MRIERSKSQTSIGDAGGVKNRSLRGSLDELTVSRNEKARFPDQDSCTTRERVRRVQDYGFLFHKRPAYSCSQGSGAKGDIMPTQKLSIYDLQVNVSIRGDGSPLLLLNGLGGLIRAFDPLRNELSDYDHHVGCARRRKVPDAALADAFTTPGRHDCADAHAIGFRRG